MEDIMKTGLRGELEPNSHGIDVLHHAVRPDEPRIELAGGGARQRRRLALPEPKQSPVTHLVLHQAVMPVVHTLLDRLSLR
jgi:hypothetical protein